MASVCVARRSTAIADTTIDADISTRKQKHGERPSLCPRGPVPKTATIVDRMSRKLLTKTGAAVYAARKGMVEPVIVQIKQARGFRQFLLRGVEKVQRECRWSARPTTFSSCIACASETQAAARSAVGHILDADAAIAERGDPRGGRAARRE